MSSNQVTLDDMFPKPTDQCLCGSGAEFARCCGGDSPRHSPPRGVMVRPGWLDTDQCDALVGYFNTQPSKWLTINDGKSERLDPDRVTETVELGEQSDTINALIRRAYIEVAEPELGCAVDWFSYPVVLRYSSGGHYGAHADSEIYDVQNRHWKKVIDRDVSMLLYLNEDFDGGAVSFIRFGYRYQPRKGDLIMFPSDARYLHRAEPVTNGTRYAVVTWGAQRGERKVAPTPPKAVFVH